MSEQAEAARVYPRDLACEWIPAGFYVVRCDGAACALADPNAAADVMHRLVDPRLERLPQGNC